jgi:type IV secretion system protein VirB6
MSGLFTAIGGTLENGMSSYVTNVSSALSSALVPVVSTALSIWIIAYGLAIVRGEAHESVPAFAWRGLKVALILAFALGSGVYQQQVVTAISGATSGLAQTIQKAANTTGQGNPGCASSGGATVTAASAAGIYQTLDCYDQQIDLVLDAYSEKASHEGLSPSGFVSAIGDIVCGLVAAVGGTIFIIVLAFEVAMARMLLDLVLGLGPIFIACAAFSSTARFFEAWTAKVANYVLLQILVAAFLGMALTAFSTELTTFHVTTSTPSSNASALVAAGQAALEASAAWGAALGMLATAAFLAMIGWQLPAVAAGLSGGATVSGFGAFVAGAVSRRIGSVVGQALSRGERGRSNGGNGNGRNGGGPGRSGGAGVSGAGPTAAYQRAARQNLQQHIS